MTDCKLGTERNTHVRSDEKGQVVIENDKSETSKTYQLTKKKRSLKLIKHIPKVNHKLKPET